MLAAGCGKPKTVKEDIVAESEEKDTVDITTDPTNSPTPTIKTEDDFTEERFQKRRICYNRQCKREGKPGRKF